MRVFVLRPRRKLLNRLWIVTALLFLLPVCATQAQVPGAPPVGAPVDPMVPNNLAPQQLPVTPPLKPEGAMTTLQPGDVVTMTVFGRPELTSNIYISDHGTMDVPLAGSIPVLGLSPAAAAERVATAYREGEYLVDPQVNIVLAAFRSQQYSVLGEVAHPGRFEMVTRTSVLDALAQAGGVSAQGADTAYILRRRQGGVDRFEVDLHDLLTNGTGQVTELRSGDTVVVPKAQLFYIYGEVHSPNSYALRANMTVIQAISVAGGLTDRGSSRRVEIRRKMPDGRLQSRDADVNDPVQAEDVVYVKERIF